jgi:hypothetical protein
LSDLSIVHLQQLVVDLGHHCSAQRIIDGEQEGSGASEAGVRHRAAMGIDVIGELAALDPELSARMGQDGVRIRQLARGWIPGRSCLIGRSALR